MRPGPCGCPPTALSWPKLNRPTAPTGPAAAPVAPAAARGQPAATRNPPPDPSAESVWPCRQHLASPRPLATTSATTPLSLRPPRLLPSCRPQRAPAAPPPVRGGLPDFSQAVQDASQVVTLAPTGSV
eukprot:gene10071-8923_t